MLDAFLSIFMAPLATLHNICSLPYHHSHTAAFSFFFGYSAGGLESQNPQSGQQGKVQNIGVYHLLLPALSLKASLCVVSVVVSMGIPGIWNAST